MSENEPIEAAQRPDAEQDLRHGMRGDRAAKTILLRLLDAIEANEAGVLLNEDPEALHDFRIAVRRSRSALSQMKNVFPARDTRRFAPRLKWLGDITSEPRDLDVYLLGFDGLKADLAAPFRAPIEPLRGFLAHHADFAHARLARHIHSQRYRTLLTAWRKFLSAPCSARPSAADALKPIGDIANQRLWTLFHRVLKQGRRIRPHTPAENIHALRKTCKKLRYLLEFFRALYAEDDIKPPLKQLKKLQDYLGDFQDVHARIAMLRGISQEMRKSPAVPTETLMALGALLAALEQRQATLRGEFPEHFMPFADADNRARFRRLCAPDSEELAPE